MTTWWKIVTFGSLYDGPRGPWHSEAEAEEALGRWRDRKGYQAGSIESASSLRIVGPFPTRSVAQEADISDYTKYTVAAPPYPFCRTPAVCAGKGYCPQDPACND